MTNTIDLLKVEVEREEALVAQERRQLEELEKNAKRAESERKRQTKNVRLFAQRLLGQSHIILTQRLNQNRNILFFAD
jgi:kinetochore protein Fta7